MKLSNATLDALPASVSRPSYDRGALTPGIVHIGLGNFHRAHQAWYLHRLMQAGEAHDWAIVGAGVRAYDMGMRDRLVAQDCLTTLIELDPKGRSAEVVGSMIDYLPVEEGHGPLIRQMADPAIRIVALTITEGGYYRDADGAFDADHEDIVFDMANPDHPRTAFGAIVAALKLRRAAGHGPFTALSCDNLQGNGEILRSCVTTLARMTDPSLADWLEQHGAFPNSMVDCIVPVTSPELIETARTLGVDDAAPVSHEVFRQWVIEDDFCAGRPAWEKVGATLTDNVHQYEAMKLRILNAGHQLLANAGELLSQDTIADCMADAEISGFLRKVMADDVLAQVDAVPGMTAAAYLDLVEGRFANPSIRDSVRRVAFDGSSRHMGFLLPTLRDALAAGASTDGLALAEALWARMCLGARDDGSSIEPNDPHWDALTKAAHQAASDPAAWLAQTDIYGDLGEATGFRAEFARWMTALADNGARATIKKYLSQAA